MYVSYHGHCSVFLTVPIVQARKGLPQVVSLLFRRCSWKVDRVVPSVADSLGKAAVVSV